MRLDACHLIIMGSSVAGLAIYLLRRAITGSASFTAQPLLTSRRCRRLATRNSSFRAARAQHVAMLLAAFLQNDSWRMDARRVSPSQFPGATSHAKPIFHVQPAAG